MCYLSLCFCFMRSQRAGNDPEPANQQHQHHNGVEQSGGLKVDMHVSNHASQDEKRAACGKHPADCAFSIPEKDRDTEKHRNESDSEGVRAVEAPVWTNHAYLIREQVPS